MGSFRPGAGNQHLHWYFNFTGCIVETVLKSLRLSCGSELTRQGISAPFRSALVPVTQIGSRLAMPLILIGLLLPVQYDVVVNIGIALYSLSVLFQLVTLPVEFNASARALQALDATGILYPEELEGAKKVLRAAAMTYVAATFTAFLSLLRLLLIFGGRRNDN